MPNGAKCIPLVSMMTVRKHSAVHPMRLDDSAQPCLKAARLSSGCKHWKPLTVQLHLAASLSRPWRSWTAWCRSCGRRSRRRTLAASTPFSTRLHAAMSGPSRRWCAAAWAWLPRLSCSSKALRLDKSLESDAGSTLVYPHVKVRKQGSGEAYNAIVQNSFLGDGAQFSLVCHGQLEGCEADTAAPAHCSSC
jgi:hypothetical protein